MNGVIDITVGDKSYRLRFGMMGCMEFEKRLFKTASDNTMKILTDLIYSGMFGEAIRNEEAIPVYADVADIMDDFGQQKDFKQQTDAVYKAYESSKWGGELMQKLNPSTGKKKRSYKKIDPSKDHKVLIEIGLGKMGLSIAEFATLTPYFFQLKLTGYKESLDKEENNLRKLVWVLVGLNVDKKTANKISINDIWPMEGDKSRKPKIESNKVSFNKLLEAFKQKKNNG